jgi:hypothetical protein
MQVSSFRSLSIGDKVIAVPFGTLTITNAYSRIHFPTPGTFEGSENLAYVTVDGIGELSELDADTIGLPN